MARIWFSTQAEDYWPLTNSLFWLQWRISDSNPIGYHVVSWLLHLASALLIWRILRMLEIPGAFLAALLFAVHPVNVQSVAWISEQKNALAMVFVLMSILWYLQAEEEKSRRGAKEKGGWNRRYWLSLLAFVLAMLSKGSVAILPLVLVLIVWWQRQRITGGDLWRAAPFFVVAAGLTAVNVWFTTHGTDVVVRDVTIAQRLAGAGAAVWFYLSKALVPIDLVFIYPLWHIPTSDLLWWLPLAACVAVTAVLWSRRKWPAGWARSAAVRVDVLLRGASASAGLCRCRLHAVFTRGRSLSAPGHYQRDRRWRPPAGVSGAAKRAGFGRGQRTVLPWRRLPRF